MKSIKFSFVLAFLFSTCIMIPSLHAAPSDPADGIVFSDADWTIGNHAEDSYAALNKYLSEHSRQLSDGDYYTSIFLKPQFATEAGRCDSNANPVVRFFNALFGSNQASLLVTTLTAYYNTSHSRQTAFLVNTPLFAIGRGIDPANGTASTNGCFFTVLPSQRFPYLRKDYSSHSQYTLLFTTRAATSVTSNAVGAVKNAIATIAAIAGFTDLSGVRTAAIISAANDFQNALASAFSTAGGKTTEKILVTGPGSNDGHDLLWRTNVFNDSSSTLGNYIIYAHMSGSLLLDNREQAIKIFPDDVLTDLDLGAIKCMPEQGSDTCKPALRPLSTALMEIKDLPGNFFQFDDSGYAKVLDTCNQIRRFAIGNLGLSTTDVLFVRWAVAKSSGLDAILNHSDNVIAQKIADKSSSKASIDTLKKACWGPDDEQILNDLLQKTKVKKVLSE